jgi:RimJ/RimL family protein N-acetyltransferase
MRSSGPVSLRRATVDDFDLILKWRNAETTVRFSKRRRSVTREEYLPVYQAAFRGNDPRCVALIACSSDGVPIGFLRFDAEPVRRDAEITIVLDAEQHGKGFGTEAIRQACLFAREELRLERLTAVIDPENSGSVRAFVKAGFQRIADAPGFSTFERRLG